jgi:hypothetical protein
MFYQETLKKTEIDLAELIESKINSINDLKSDLLKEKFKVI